MPGGKQPISVVLARFWSYIQVFQKPIDLQEELETSLLRRNEKTPGIRDDLLQVEVSLRTVFGPKSEALRKFGVKPIKKRRRLTGKEKLRKAERAAATRKGRGTLGKRQKKLLKTKLRDANPPAPQVPPTGGPSPERGR